MAKYNKIEVIKTMKETGMVPVFYHSDLNIAKNGTASTITVGDNTTANGTLTVNGTTYPITGAYLEKCTYTEAGTLEAALIQFYFGEGQDYVASFKYKGKKQ